MRPKYEKYKNRLNDPRYITIEDYQAAVRQTERRMTAIQRPDVFIIEKQLP